MTIPAVGDIAEIELTTTTDVLRLVCVADYRTGASEGPIGWRPIQREVGGWFGLMLPTAVRPLRLVDADAVVLPAANGWGQKWEAKRLRPVAKLARADGYPIAADVVDAVCDALDAAAVVPDEGGGENDVSAFMICPNGLHPIPVGTVCDSAPCGESRPTELRTDEGRAFVLRTVADALGQGWAISNDLQNAADRLSAPTTPGEAVSGVSGELSGTEGAVACDHEEHDLLVEAVAVAEGALRAARAEAARYKAAAAYAREIIAELIGYEDDATNTQLLNLDKILAAALSGGPSDGAGQDEL